jgi:hypothetical protein
VAYEEILSTLIRRGAKEPNIRTNRYAALNQFLQANRVAVTLHNEYARTYNKQFEGKHERFYLPVFGSLEAAESGESYVAGIRPQAQENPEIENITRRESSTGHEAALSHKMDSAIDIENVAMQKIIERESDALLEGPMQSTEPGRLDDRNTDETAEKRTKTGFQEASEGTRQPAQGETLGEEESVLQVEVFEMLSEDLEILEVEPMDEDVVDTRMPETFPITEATGAPPHPMTVLRGSAGAALETKAIADQAVEPHDDTSAMAEVVVQKREEDIARNENHLPTPPLHEPEPSASVAIAPSQSVPQKQSAKSYLAWLHHRQTRFPTAAPNSSECIAIAKKLGRLHVHVYDEIVYHWGLETSSEWGGWYKENRQEALGEDPRFDEETMGMWKAWLKEGRELKRAYRC